MGLFSPAATYTIGDDPADDLGTSDTETTGVHAAGTDRSDSAPPARDPEQIRALLRETRDRAEGTRRRKPRRIAGETGGSGSPRTLIAAGAIALALLIGLTAGSHLAHRNAAPARLAPSHADHRRPRPHTRRARPRSRMPRAVALKSPATRRGSARITAPGTPLIRPPAHASPTPTPTRPAPPAAAGGEFVIGGP
jgi:hypothetical protein